MGLLEAAVSGRQCGSHFSAALCWSAATSGVEPAVSQLPAVQYSGGQGASCSELTAAVGQMTHLAAGLSYPHQQCHRTSACTKAAWEGCSDMMLAAPWDKGQAGHQFAQPHHPACPRGDPGPAALAFHPVLPGRGAGTWVLLLSLPLLCCPASLSSQHGKGGSAPSRPAQGFPQESARFQTVEGSKELPKLGTGRI